ncbi:hypothetical protein BJF79_25505 [Actinomadura sp. CNU-125]|nr:hypothetical protein BJF79_25505 [Actinomadura sp. CNU-125]
MTVSAPSRVTGSDHSHVVYRVPGAVFSVEGSAAVAAFGMYFPKAPSVIEVHSSGNDAYCSCAGDSSPDVAIRTVAAVAARTAASPPDSHQRRLRGALGRSVTSGTASGATGSCGASAERSEPSSS